MCLYDKLLTTKNNTVSFLSCSLIRKNVFCDIENLYFSKLYVISRVMQLKATNIIADLNINSSLGLLWMTLLCPNIKVILGSVISHKMLNMKEKYMFILLLKLCRY